MNGQLDLAGHGAELRRESAHQRLGEDDTGNHQDTGYQDQRVDDRVGEGPGAFPAVQCQLPGKRRHKRRAHRAFSEEVTHEVGNAPCDAERVGRGSGAEVIGEDLIPNQPENTARDGGQPEDPGGPGQAW